MHTSGNGCRDEIHEPGENLHPHGQIRERIRGPGRADVRHGGRHVAVHGDQRAAGGRGAVDEAGGGRGWVGVEHGVAGRCRADHRTVHGRVYRTGTGCIC